MQQQTKSSQVQKAVNENSGCKKTNKAKLRAKNETERLKVWKEHFHKLLGKTPTMEYANIMPVINRGFYVVFLDIVKGTFTMVALRTALKNTKYGKACGFDNIAGEVWKIDDFNDILL